MVVGVNPMPVRPAIFRKHGEALAVRCVQAAGVPSSSTYLHPLTPENREELERRWAACRSTAGPASAESVPVMFGRSIQLSADQVGSEVLIFWWWYVVPGRACALNCSLRTKQTLMYT